MKIAVISDVPTPNLEALMAVLARIDSLEFIASSASATSSVTTPTTTPAFASFERATLRIPG